MIYWYHSLVGILTVEKMAYIFKTYNFHISDLIERFWLSLLGSDAYPGPIIMPMKM